MADVDDTGVGYQPIDVDKILENVSMPFDPEYFLRTHVMFLLGAAGGAMKEHPEVARNILRALASKIAEQYAR